MKFLLVVTPPSIYQDIFQAELRNGTFAKESIWKTAVLIPRGAIRYFRGIGLVKVFCKAVTSLLNLRLMSSIKFHDLMHGFGEVRGTGTVDLKDKLIQQLMAMREAVLFEVFLDIQKAYAALDWDRCLDILVAYGVDPRSLRLLWTYWEQLTMVARAGG